MCQVVGRVSVEPALEQVPPEQTDDQIEIVPEATTLPTPVGYPHTSGQKQSTPNFLEPQGQFNILHQHDGRKTADGGQNVCSKELGLIAKADPGKLGPAVIKPRNQVGLPAPIFKSHPQRAADGIRCFFHRIQCSLQCSRCQSAIGMQHHDHVSAHLSDPGRDLDTAPAMGLDDPYAGIPGDAAGSVPGSAIDNQDFLEAGLIIDGSDRLFQGAGLVQGRNNDRHSPGTGSGRGLEKVYRSQLAKD